MYLRSGEDIDITIRHDFKIERINSQLQECKYRILSGEIGQGAANDENSGTNRGDAHELATSISIIKALTGSVAEDINSLPHHDLYELSLPIPGEGLEPSQSGDRQDCPCACALWSAVFLSLKTLAILCLLPRFITSLLRCHPSFPPANGWRQPPPCASIQTVPRSLDRYSSRQDLLGLLPCGPVVL